MKATMRKGLGALLGVLLALAPGSALAVDGTITGLSFSPAPAKKNQDVTITVEGTEKCKKLNVNFGDQSPVVTLDNADFENNNLDDNSITHKYATEGSYTVTATPVEQCGGTAQETLTVKAGLVAIPTDKVLCKILDNCGDKVKFAVAAKTVMKFLPRIEGIFPFSVIEPGGAVILTGKGFGETKGEAHIYLKTDGKDFKLDVETWGNNGIGGKIPTYAINVVDQPAEFYVKTAGGVESNRYGPVSFTAKRGIKILPRSAVELTFFGCGNSADCDSCLNWKDPDDGGCFAGGTSQGTLDGYHWQDCGLIGNDTGTDKYRLKSPLKNGWVLDAVHLHKFVDPGEGNANASISSNQIQVNWSISPCDGILYFANVIIKGPMGTDY